MNGYGSNNFYYAAQPYPLYRPDISVTNVKSRLRRIWGEHVSLIRMVIVSLVLDLPDSTVVVNRLLKTATDMGDSLRPFYGRQVGDTYTKLFKEHITLAGDLIGASKKGDTGKAAEIEKSWFRNGDEISAYLNRINPYISLPKFKKSFHSHLSMSKQQAVSMMQKDYQTNMALYDMMLTEGLEMADMMADAIIQQFSNRPF